jgi:tRNA (guanine37-N1)-methyltransferase
MHFDILTLFPHMFDTYFNESILGRAQKEGKISVQAHQLRDWSTDEKHHRVDDTPYGGGAGMVLMVEPIFRAVEELRGVRSTEYEVSEIQNTTPPHPPAGGGVRFDSEGEMRTRTILFSAKGKRFTQEDARRLTEYDRLILICGRYEGVDERVAEQVIDEELSIGDFVLTGGELPAMVVVDAVARLLPEVLGNAESAVTESHTEAGVLEHPQYTKPEEFNGWRVPEVLLSGHHENIDRWRKQNSSSR